MNLDPLIIQHCAPVIEFAGSELHAEDLKNIHARQVPRVIRGFAHNWPACSITQDTDFADYLLSFYNHKDLGCFVGRPEIEGRFFYEEGLEALNFSNQRMKMNDVLAKIQDPQDKQSYYIGSATISAFLEGFCDENELAFDLSQAMPNLITSAWLGNQSRISCHYDTPDNLAVCVHGRRRIVLFAPETIKNLYPGPLHPTPAGQTVSVVDFHQVDLEKYPNFEHALAHGLICELEPGDALFIPSMWWHHIEALAPLNLLVNYWWHENPPWIGQSISALHAALLSIKDLPKAQRNAWKAIFDYYVFDQSDSTDHLPASARTFIGESSQLDAKRLRAMLNQRLNT